MTARSVIRWTGVGVAFALGASAAWFVGAGALRGADRYGIEPRSGFVMQEADLRKSRAYLNFLYGLLYQERGQRDQAAERFAEACALDRVLQPSFESDQNPS